MAEKAEDLIGHYLADLFETDSCTADGESKSGESKAIESETIATEPADGASSVAPEPRSVAVISVSPGIAPPAQNYARLENELITPKLKSLQPPIPTPALDEPVRQQLQQLLDSAWQSKPISLLSEPVVVPAPTKVIPEELVIPEMPAPECLESTEILDAQTDAIESKPCLPAAGIASKGKPAWAEKTFDSLIIEVAGLKLAIPLIVLGQIVQVSDGFGHLPGQGPLFLGTLQTPRGALRVINTALLVMPERYDAGFIGSVRFVVSLAGEIDNDAPWQLALGVSRVAQPVSLACDDVVWRGERSKRPWLLGTVKSHMCALLDVAVIRQMFSVGG